MALNLNAEPYYDDYDDTKGFYRILFRPGYAVQARELTQLQTNIQKQLGRFGEHVFREGSIVLGGAFDIETDINYVKISTFDVSVISGAGITYFLGKVVVGADSGVKAHIRSVEYDSVNQNYVFLLRYTASSPTTDATAFVDGEVLRLETNTNVTATAAVSASTGIGSLFTIAEGVLFSKGYFVVFPKQSVVIDLYSSTPTATVGFKITESIVSAEQDESLLDNAQGTYNYAAPGADRLAVEANLLTLAYGEGATDPDFTPLFSIKDGVVEERFERSQYARVYEEIAKRTFDESGDYYVNGFGVRTREHLDTGLNEGLYSAANGGDSDLLSIDVEPGLAYVKGYEVNHLVTKHLITDKSTAFNRVNSQFVTARTGNYIVVDQVVGSVVLDKGTLVTLYDTAEDRVTINRRSSVGASGLAIGTARVKSVAYESGVLGTPSGRLRIYLYDIQMNSGYGFSDSRAIYNNSTYDFFADIVLTSGTATLRDTFDGDLLFPIGSDFTRNIKSDGDAASDTTFIFHKTENKNINLDSDGGSFTVSLTGETLPYSPGTLSDEEKRQILVTIEADQKFALPGTVSGTSGQNFLTGTSTFLTRLNAGDRISVGGTGSSLGDLYYIDYVDDNSTVYLTSDLSTNYSSVEVARAFLTGDLIDLTVKGSSGSVRTVEVQSSSAMKIDLKEDISDADVSGTVLCSVSYRASKTSAIEIEKDLFANRYVKIDCSTLSSLTDPINLGYADVYRIKEIRKDDTEFTSASQGIVVTDQFIFDNGQRDNLYDHGKIKPLTTLTEDDFLLVKLDVFVPDYSTGSGYFSIDSYPVDDTVESDTTIFTYQIPSYTSSTGTVYNLRDMLDFRPIKQNTANEAATTVAQASINPPTTTTFLRQSAGFLTAVPNSNISIDYSYYLARRDVITLDKDGQFAIVQGTPAIYPTTPKTSDNVMEIARVYIPPYPSISETLGRVIGSSVTCLSERVANIRYTMRDIGTLKQRIDTLEYYNALTLLEKSAIDLSILDENGLDRFKNGFFVDGFLDHSLGATTNPDYSVAVDKVEQVLLPKFKMDSFGYRLENSSGVQQTGSIITLPYTEETLLDQPKATTIRNIEQSVFRFVGNLRMTPDTDVWVDTSVVDKTIEFGNDLPSDIVLDTEWGSWENHITGYNVYNRNAGNRTADVSNLTLRGTFTSYADAVKSANSVTRTKLETVTTEIRSGIKTTVSTQTDTQSLGNLVTDVSLVPYIRPQTITLYASGIKPNTKVYVFFDGEDMNEYLTPMVIPEGGVQDATLFLAEGAEWVADEFGEVLGILRLPTSGKRFRIGTKEVIITDSPTNAIDATTYAKSYFVAYGLNQQKQNTILSTKTAVVLPEVVFETRKSTKVDIYGPSCMAYTFKVDVPPGEEGVFLTSVDVFIQAMHPTLGVWFEIREVNSGGGITRTQVPYSEVWMKRDDPRIVLTNDGSTPTNVNFPSPVFLYNDTQYAFVIHTEGLNPDTYFWVSRLGENEVSTGLPVTSRQLTGTLYTTNNNLNYDMVPDVDLKVKFNRAKFNTSSTGSITLANIEHEFITVDIPTNTFTTYGETIVGSAALTLSGVSGTDTIAVGDVIVGTTSEVEGEVLNINGLVYQTDGIGFVQGEAFTVVGKDKVGTLGSVNAGQGRLAKYDSTTLTLTLSNSNGKFFNGAVLRGLTSEIETTITGFDRYKYSVVNFKPNYLSFNNTSASFETRGYKTSTSSMGSYIAANADSTFAFASEKAILSRSVEISGLGGSGSAQVQGTLASTSEYLSPVVDITRSHSVYVFNVINDDVTGELTPQGGSLLNKYISKTVTLADGQDAEDMLVTLSAYRPPGSEIYVWIKVKNGEDSQAFEDKPWIVMVPRSSPFSSIANKGNFVELNYDVDPAYMNNGIIEYEHEGNTYVGIKQFAIKIGLAGTNSALVPRVGDLRSIALQK